MVALRYGTIPIVRETGGLKDTIQDSGDGEGNGFTFATYNAHDMLEAVWRALAGYADADGWNTDTTDEDLEELSRAVYEAPRRRSPNLLGIAAGLLLLAAALGWLVMKERGLLP